MQVTVDDVLTAWPCKICGYGELFLVHHVADGPWYRCPLCGSDSSPTRYADIAHRYNADYLAHHVANLQGRGVEEMRENLDWFAQFEAPEKTFLDVGCLEGSALDGMTARGWECWGFDVFGEPALNIVIAPQFHADHFTRQFGAVMAREVLEHVEDWKGFLGQCFAALLPGGLFQVQTPRPGKIPDPIPYHWAHLHLHSPMALFTWLEKIGFEIVGQGIWPLGQKFMCRKPR